MQKNGNQERYFAVLRFGTFGVAGFLWLLSVMWSADGFGIKLVDWKWAGYGLALGVTVVQLVFNRGTLNPTLYFGGVAAYVYGVATNVIGLIHITKLEFSSWIDTPVDSFFSLLLVLALSFVVEVLPESLLLWALNPEQGSPGDFISSLFGGSGLIRKNKPNNRQNLPVIPNIRQQNVPNRSENVQQEQNNKQTSKPTNKQQTNGFPKVKWDRLAEEERKIVGFARNYYNRTGKLPTSPTKVSHSLYNTSSKKGYISTVLSKLRNGEYS